MVSSAAPGRPTVNNPRIAKEQQTRRKQQLIASLPDASIHFWIGILYWAGEYIVAEVSQLARRRSRPHQWRRGRLKIGRSSPGLPDPRCNTQIRFTSEAPEIGLARFSLQR